MRRARLALLALLAPLILGQTQPRPGEVQPRLVPDVSQEHIEIRYSFSGAELLLFGAILYPGGQTPARPPDIAVVLKGPLERIVLREKQRVAGIWMNVERARFRSVPAFYAVASSRPLSQLINERTAAIWAAGSLSAALNVRSNPFSLEKAAFIDSVFAERQPLSDPVCANPTLIASELPAPEDAVPPASPVEPEQPEMTSDIAPIRTAPASMRFLMCGPP